MQTKGTTIIFIPEFIKKNFGEEAYIKWFNLLSAEAKKVYSGVIFPGNWYPLIEISTEPARLICNLFYNGDLEKGALEIGRFSADYALRGVYRFFVRIGSPEFILKKGSAILPTYFDPCKLEVVGIQKGRVILHITEFTEMNSIVEGTIIGWVERAIEIAGGKNVNVVVAKSLARGDSLTEGIITWK